MASPMLCLHEVEDLWAKCWTDQSLSVLKLKIRWGRSFASLSLFMQWLCDCGLYGVIRNVVLGMRGTWALLLSKTCQSVCVLELWCEDSRDEGNAQVTAMKAQSVCKWGATTPWPVLCSQAAPGGAVVMCRSPTELSPRHGGFWLGRAVLHHSVVSSREIA